VRRLILLAAAICALVLAAPASAQLNDYKNGGSVPTCKYSDKQLGGQLGDLPPDIEQYAPGYADELRNARGAPCGGKGAGSNGATGGSGPGVENVPDPASGGGTDGGGAGGSGGADGGPGTGAGAGVKVNTPPGPKPEPRKRLANASSPAVTTRPSGPDVPLWAVILVAAVLLIGSALGAMYIFGADFSRFSRPLGAAAGEARARTSDRALQLWETVRYGR
jgi:hypothetical protein